MPAGRSSRGVWGCAGGQLIRRSSPVGLSGKLTSGYDAEAFGPQDPIAREQLAVMLYRYAAGQGYDLTAGDDLSAYTDVDCAGGYARTAVAWANAKGILTGVGRETLLPRGNATRAQITAVLMQFCAAFAGPV